MDRFGLDLFNPTPERVRTIAALAARGYADRMVLAHDAVKASVTPNWHYTHISDDVLPALREAGVTEGQIEQMLVGNPRRYFAGSAS